MLQQNIIKIIAPKFMSRSLEKLNMFSNERQLQIKLLFQHVAHLKQDQERLLNDFRHLKQHQQARWGTYQEEITHIVRRQNTIIESINQKFTNDIARLTSQESALKTFSARKTVAGGQDQRNLESPTLQEDNTQPETEQQLARTAPFAKRDVFTSSGGLSTGKRQDSQPSQQKSQLQRHVSELKEQLLQLKQDFEQQIDALSEGQVQLQEKVTRSLEGVGRREDLEEAVAELNQAVEQNLSEAHQRTEQFVGECFEKVQEELAKQLEQFDEQQQDLTELVKQLDTRITTVEKSKKRAAETDEDQQYHQKLEQRLQQLEQQQQQREQEMVEHLANAYEERSEQLLAQFRAQLLQTQSESEKRLATHTQKTQEDVNKLLQQQGKAHQQETAALRQELTGAQQEIARLKEEVRKREQSEATVKKDQEQQKALLQGQQRQIEQLLQSVQTLRSEAATANKLNEQTHNDLQNLKEGTSFAIEGLNNKNSQLGLQLSQTQERLGHLIEDRIRSVRSQLLEELAAASSQWPAAATAAVAVPAKDSAVSAETQQLTELLQRIDKNDQEIKIFRTTVGMIENQTRQEVRKCKNELIDLWEKCEKKVEDTVDALSAQVQEEAQKSEEIKQSLQEKEEQMRQILLLDKKIQADNDALKERLEKNGSAEDDYKRLLTQFKKNEQDLREGIQNVHEELGAELQNTKVELQALRERTQQVSVQTEQSDKALAEMLETQNSTTQQLSELAKRVEQNRELIRENSLQFQDFESNLTQSHFQQNQKFEARLREVEKTRKELTQLVQAELLQSSFVNKEQLDALLLNIEQRLSSHQEREEPAQVEHYQSDAANQQLHEAVDEKLQNFKSFLQEQNEETKHQIIEQTNQLSENINRVQQNIGQLSLRVQSVQQQQENNESAIQAIQSVTQQVQESTNKKYEALKQNLNSQREETILLRATELQNLSKNFQDQFDQIIATVQGNDQTVQAQLKQFTDSLAKLESAADQRSEAPSGQAIHSYTQEITAGFRAEVEKLAERVHEISVSNSNVQQKCEQLRQQMDDTSSADHQLLLQVSQELYTAQTNQNQESERLAAQIQDIQSRVQEALIKSANLPEQIASVQSQLQERLEKLLQEYATQAKSMQETLQSIALLRLETEDLKQQVSKLAHDSETAQQAAQAKLNTHDSDFQRLEQRLTELRKENLQSLRLEDFKSRIQEDLVLTASIVGTNRGTPKNQQAVQNTHQQSKQATQFANIHNNKSYLSEAPLTESTLYTGQLAASQLQQTDEPLLSSQLDTQQQKQKTGKKKKNQRVKTEDSSKLQQFVSGELSQPPQLQNLSASQTQNTEQHFQNTKLKEVQQDINESAANQSALQELRPEDFGSFDPENKSMTQTDTPKTIEQLLFQVPGSQQQQQQQQQVIVPVVQLQQSENFQLQQKDNTASEKQIEGSATDQSEQEQNAGGWFTVTSKKQDRNSVSQQSKTSLTESQIAASESETGKKKKKKKNKKKNKKPQQETEESKADDDQRSDTNQTE